MVEINLVEGVEFKDGADIKLSVSLDPMPNPYQVGDEELTAIDNVFHSTAISAKLKKIQYELNHCSENFDEKLIANVFEEIFDYNIQTYYDILQIASVIITKSLNEERAEFFLQIAEIVAAINSFNHESTKDEAVMPAEEADESNDEAETPSEDVEEEDKE